MMILLLKVEIVWLLSQVIWVLNKNFLGGG